MYLQGPFKGKYAISGLRQLIDHHEQSQMSLDLPARQIVQIVPCSEMRHLIIRARAESSRFACTFIACLLAFWKLCGQEATVPTRNSEGLNLRLAFESKVLVPKIG